MVLHGEFPHAFQNISAGTHRSPRVGPTHSFGVSTMQPGTRSCLPNPYWMTSRPDGFTPNWISGRAVDRTLFYPRPEVLKELPRPVFVSVWDGSRQKNLPAFLELDVPGTKLVFGDGPSLMICRRGFQKRCSSGNAKVAGPDLCRSRRVLSFLAERTRSVSFMEAIASRPAGRIIRSRITRCCRCYRCGAFFPKT